MNRFEQVAQRLSKSELPYSCVKYIFSQIDELSQFDDIDNIHALGFPLVKTSENYATLNTRLTLIEEQEFCFVDIETNGNDVEHAQIIEIGAIMLKNGVEIDRFESKVYADEIPESISELTGIKVEDLEHAPSLCSVLEKFRLFIKDAVFVAHNAKFDYAFISDSFEKNGFGPMLNRRLCTIDLAQKTIKAKRYGLDYLKELLHLEEGDLHRAIWDAYYAKEIFLYALKNLPEDVFTTEELINFSKPQNQRKAKKEVIKDKKHRHHGGKWHSKPKSDKKMSQKK